MTRPMLIAVTGGSGSGKSTLCAVLRERFEREACALVSEDWYYRDLSLAAGFDPRTIDFDDVSVRDHDLLIAHLEALRRGAAVEAPQYCFVRHAREARTAKVPPAPVILVEGSHLLCRRDLAVLFDLRVYLDVPDDIRLIRRILRDQAERGRSLESVLDQYLRTVRPAQMRLTAPSRAAADLVLQDDGAAVRAPDQGDVLRLAAPILADPRLAPFLAR